MNTDKEKDTGGAGTLLFSKSQPRTGHARARTGQPDPTHKYELPGRAQAHKTQPHAFIGGLVFPTNSQVVAHRAASVGKSFPKD